MPINLFGDPFNLQGNGQTAALLSLTYNPAPVAASPSPAPAPVVPVAAPAPVPAAAPKPVAAPKPAAPRPAAPAPAPAPSGPVFYRQNPNDPNNQTLVNAQGQPVTY